MKRNKAIKYRIYPNLTQMAIIAMIFGCVRKVYNEMLDVQIGLYARDENAAVNIRNEGIRILKEMGYIKSAKAA